MPYPMAQPVSMQRGYGPMMMPSYGQQWPGY
jgi:hypothetical protein